MGIHEFFGQIITKTVHDWKSSDEEEIDVLMIDANFILYTIEYTDDERFISDLLNILEDLITKKLKPKIGLIIAFDGKVPRAKMAQQTSRRFLSAYETKNDPQQKFNKLNFTAGLPLMGKISYRIQEWIAKKRSFLPQYTYFSGTDEFGEGEHKMFKIYETMKNTIYHDYVNYPNSKKSIVEIIDSLKVVILGNDSDICVLSMLKDYNILWLRTIPEGTIEYVDIQKIKKHFIELMGGDYNNKEMVKILIHDFMLLTFFIGDDFISAIFTFTLNVAISLNLMLNIYKDNFFNRATLLYNNNEINYDQLFIFIDILAEKEKDMYELMNLAEKLEYLNHVNPNGINEEGKRNSEAVINFRENIGRNKNAAYSLYEPLNQDFHSFCSFWRDCIVCPSKAFNFSERRFSYKFYNFQELLIVNSNEEFENSCYEYLLGLQWNVYYYNGYNVSNWFYKYTFSPLVTHLNDFIKKYNSQIPFNTESLYLNNNPVFSATQHLFSVLNYNLSISVLSQCFTNEKEFPLKLPKIQSEVTARNKISKLTTRSKYYPCYNPKMFNVFSFGCYFNPKYGVTNKVVCIPKIPNEDIFKIETDRLVENYSKITYSHFIGIDYSKSNIEDKLKYTIVNSKTIERKEEVDGVNRNLRKRDKNKDEKKQNDKNEKKATIVIKGAEKSENKNKEQKEEKTNNKEKSVSVNENNGEEKNVKIKISKGKILSGQLKRRDTGFF